MEPRSKRVVSLFVVLALLSACASIGGGRPDVVRAEDVLVNSLVTYDAAMTWHAANSTKETPAVYRVFEKVRVGFPKLHQTLQASVSERKKLGASPTLQDDLVALENLMKELATVWK